MLQPLAEPNEFRSGERYRKAQGLLLHSGSSRPLFHGDLVARHSSAQKTTTTGVFLLDLGSQCL